MRSEAPEIVHDPQSLGAGHQVFEVVRVSRIVGIAGRCDHHAGPARFQLRQRFDDHDMILWRQN